MLLQHQVSALPAVHRRGAMIGIVSKVDLLCPLADSEMQELARVPEARDLMDALEDIHGVVAVVPRPGHPS